MFGFYLLKSSLPGWIDKKKNTNREIIENGRGFDGLRESLDFWIDDKLKEIQQKEKFKRLLLALVRLRTIYRFGLKKA